MRISDWSSTCALPILHQCEFGQRLDHPAPAHDRIGGDQSCLRQHLAQTVEREEAHAFLDRNRLGGKFAVFQETRDDRERILILLRSEEHTSELHSLMRISYAVLCLKKKTVLSQTH